MNDHLPYAQLTRGIFLIASPEIATGFFFRSVLLLCEHSEAGSFALVVNKELAMELPEEVIDIHAAANKKIVTRSAGPNQPEQMTFLHSSEQLGQKTLKIEEGIYLGGDLLFLQEAMHQKEGPYIHLCFGYASWGPGELEKEFLTGKWFIHPASAGDLFQLPPEKLWETLLRKMGGKYASLSMIPEDLTLN